MNADDIKKAKLLKMQVASFSKKPKLSPIQIQPEKRVYYGKPGERGPRGESIKGDPGRPGRDGSRFLGSFSHESQLPNVGGCVEGDFAIVDGAIWYIV